MICPYKAWQCIVLFIFICAFIAPTANANTDSQISVTLFQIRSSSFWSDFGDFAAIVAEDLDIDLTIIEIEPNNRFDQLRQMNRVLKQKTLPDYLIYNYMYGAGSDMLERSEQAGVKTMLVNTAIPSNDQNIIGKPRAKYKTFLGHMYTDDKQAGYQLADILMQQNTTSLAQRTNRDDLGSMIAITGTAHSAAATDRNAGLNRKIAEQKEIALNRSVATKDWLKGQAKKAAQSLLQTYPDTTMIWTAADILALGAMEASIDLGRKPGEDIIIGGVDWTINAIKEVCKGRLSVTLGGHFMSGGWAVLLLHDYHHGIDFKEDMGTTIASPLQPITRENVQSFINLYNGNKTKKLKKIDFKAFSKHYNPAIKQYDFSAKRVFTEYTRKQKDIESSEKIACVK